MHRSTGIGWSWRAAAGDALQLARPLIATGATASEDDVKAKDQLKSWRVRIEGFPIVEGENRGIFYRGGRA
jgi:hypothetical protein